MNSHLLLRLLFKVDAALWAVADPTVWPLQGLRLQGLRPQSLSVHVLGTALSDSHTVALNSFGCCPRTYALPDSECIQAPLCKILRMLSTL
jgi:hypothetical protein